MKKIYLMFDKIIDLLSQENRKYQDKQEILELDQSKSSNISSTDLKIKIDSLKKLRKDFKIIINELQSSEFINNNELLNNIDFSFILEDKNTTLITDKKSFYINKVGFNSIFKKIFHVLGDVQLKFQDEEDDMLLEKTNFFSNLFSKKSKEKKEIRIKIESVNKWRIELRRIIKEINKFEFIDGENFFTKIDFTFLIDENLLNEKIKLERIEQEKLEQEAEAKAEAERIKQEKQSHSKIKFELIGTNYEIPFKDFIKEFSEIIILYKPYEFANIDSNEQLKDRFSYNNISEQQLSNGLYINSNIEFNSLKNICSNILTACNYTENDFTITNSEELNEIFN